MPRSIAKHVTGRSAARPSSGAAGSKPVTFTIGATTAVSWYVDMTGLVAKATAPPASGASAGMFAIAT